MTRTPATDGTPLTDREAQVLRGMALGRSNGQIGRELFISEDTVKVHGRRLFEKLGASDRAHAVALGFARGVLGSDPATFAVELLGRAIAPRPVVQPGGAR